MSISVSVADINAFTNRYIVPRTTDVIYKDSPLFTRMINKQKVRFEGGTSITRPIVYAKLNGGAYAKGDTFNVAYVQTDAAFSVNMKFDYVNVTLFGTDDVLNRGREAAFSLVETKMANASMRMAEILALQMYADGSSSAADVTSSSGVLSTNTSFDGLLAWVDDGNSSSTYATNTDITRSFASIGGLTRTDLFVTAPNFTGSSTPAGGVAGANSYTERAFTNFSLNGVNTAYGAAWFGNKYVDLILVQQEGWNRFWNAIQPNQRFMDEQSDLAKIGFPVLKFNAASLVVDKYMPQQLALGLNTNYLEFYVTTNPKYQFGFTGFKEAQNSDNLAGQFLFSGNIVVPNPRTCFKLTGTGLS
jgi:hypothetical protein